MRAPGTGRRGAAAVRARAGLTVLAVALGLAACSPASPAAPPPDRGDEVEVFTWWTDGAEKLALDALVTSFDEQHPDLRFVDVGVAGGAGSAAKEVLRSRLANHDPPDTFQVHGGAELREHVAAGDVQPLDALVDELGLSTSLPAPVLESVTVDGSVYALPSDLHRANVLWAHPAVLQEAGLDPFATYATLEEWFVALEAVRATGRITLALSSTWSQVHLLEVVLLAHLGPQGYTDLVEGRASAATPEVTAALVDLDRLIGYADPDRDRLDWQDAAQRVIDRDAGFLVMGDWALVAFDEAGGVSRADLVWSPVPGTAGSFDLVVDAFALPADAPHRDNALAWLRTVASAEGQAVLSAAKGAIPARSDLTTAGFGAYQRSAMASLRNDVLVPSLTHGGATDEATLAAVTTAVGRFSAGTTTVAGLQSELVDALG